MNFQEIFNQEGLYKASSFRDGVAFSIKKNQTTHELQLYTVVYKEGSTFAVDEYPTVVYAGLFDKEYEKVFTVQSLFAAK